MPGHRKRRQFKQTDAFTRGMVIGLKRAGWNVGATRVTSARVDRRILRQAVAAPQATCTAILQHVQDTLDHSISTRTISRRLVANGLHSCRPLRRLPLTPPNRRQRLKWCRARSTWMTEWHRVVFSDESRFCLSSDSRRVRVWRRRGERSNPAAIVERPTVRQRGIMVWGAIAYDSRLPLLRIQGTMTAQRYVDDVLRPVTRPYLQGVPNALYQQDNARPHTARISQQALQDVQMLPWPPYSPDLSPIEHVWDIIGRRLHALPQPRSEDELWQMVEREWRAIPQDAIRTLIDSLPRRVAACIAVRGQYEFPNRHHQRARARHSREEPCALSSPQTTPGGHRVCPGNKQLSYRPRPRPLPRLQHCCHATRSHLGIWTRLRLRVRRGHIALAVIDVHGEEMTLINAHLAHDLRVRLKQLELLAATVIQEGAWALGDLNIRDNSSASVDALAALLDLATLVDLATQFDAAHQGLLAEARSLPDPRPASSDGHVTRARSFIAAQLEASSVQADYPSLPDLARAVHFRRPVSVVRDDDGRVIEGPELRRKAHAIFRPRFVLPTCDPVAGAAFIEVTTAPIELGEKDPLHRAEISAHEVATAIHRLPRGRAPGWDGLPCELLAFFENFFAGVLQRIFAASQLRVDLPPSTRRSEICLVPKARGDCGLGRYRPISLPSADYRVLASILLGHLKPLLSALVPECQIYAVPGRSPPGTSPKSPTPSRRLLPGARRRIHRPPIRLRLPGPRIPGVPPGVPAPPTGLRGLDSPTLRRGGRDDTGRGLPDRRFPSPERREAGQCRQPRALQHRYEAAAMSLGDDPRRGQRHRLRRRHRPPCPSRRDVRRNRGGLRGIPPSLLDRRELREERGPLVRNLARARRLPLVPPGLTPPSGFWALLEAACRNATPFTRGLSLVGRARAANSLVISAIQHHLHAYDHLEAAGSRVELHLGTQPQGKASCRHLGKTRGRGRHRPDGHRHAAPSRVPEGGLGRAPRRHPTPALPSPAPSDLGGHLRHPDPQPPGGSDTSSRSGCASPSRTPSSPGGGHYLGGCRLLRPPDLLAPTRWVSACIGDFAGPAPPLTRLTRCALADAASLTSFCRRLIDENLRGTYRVNTIGQAVVLRGTTTPFLRVITRTARRILERPRLTALPIIQFPRRWEENINLPINIGWSSLRRCAFSGHNADVAVRLALHALPHPASAQQSCIACGSGDLSLVHRCWSCRYIRPLIREAFTIIGRPPDLQDWVFGHSLDDDALAILASAKTRIYKYFLGAELRSVQEDPLLVWRRTLSREKTLSNRMPAEAVPAEGNLTRGMIIGLRKAGWSIGQISVDYTSTHPQCTGYGQDGWNKEMWHGCGVLNAASHDNTALWFLRVIAYDRSPLKLIENTMMAQRYVDDLLRTVKKWVAAFKLGRISTEDEHRPGRPVESVTQENIHKIHVLVMLDRRMTVRQIEETLGVLKITVDRIIREHLGFRKLSARWVPKLLTPDQKAVRRKLSSDNLVLFEANTEEFVNRFVTMDETWAHHFTPESKQQSMQWRHSGSLPPKKAKTVPSAGKVMVSVFWDSEAVLLDFVNKGQTITGNYYANLVKQLREAIKENRRGKLSKKIVYHQDNAPSHRSLHAMAAIYDSSFELLPHAPYSPDLAPSDFHLFPHLKKSLSGIHFRSDEEVIDAVTSFFESLETSFFLEGIKALENRWKKCIDLKGDYVEK
ncbi:hypothetical protein LAZ67_2003826 [Cordylochernes scorpioides]|uniref:Transposase n=1 Tax=Cordylochernes scorpioides TaxID=51811 RepID=A0ABY6K4D1_9ARAC|nr:hypothetical protein LAZ67_2003826 [Cordylochernes scorpioides]